MSIFKTVINSFFPNTCMACGAIIGENEDFCDYCYGTLKRVDFTKNCRRCGSLKKKCECKYRVFYYSGVTAPFYNTDSAKKAMYRFKFSRQSKNAEYFADQIILSVKTAFSDVKFDYISYVPLSLKKKLRRGFNQAEVLAKKIAEILELPITENLICNGKTVNQHDFTNPKERFKNVQGLYSHKGKVKGNVLLVDDIKTTGATLNECAKQLILSGADNVYCVAGLMAERK